MTTSVLASPAAATTPLSSPSARASPSTHLRAAAGARADPEEAPLPGTTSLNDDYRSPSSSPSRSPASRLLANSPGTPTQRTSKLVPSSPDSPSRRRSRLKEASPESPRRDRHAGHATWSGPAPRQPFMPSPRKGATKPAPYPALAQIQDWNHTPTSSATATINNSSNNSNNGAASSTERYATSAAKPLVSSSNANADPIYSHINPSDEPLSPSKKALRASMMPTSVRGRDSPLESASLRTLRSNARATMTAPGTPTSQLPSRFYGGATALPSHVSSYDRDPPSSGRATPVRQEASARPRLKAAEGSALKPRSLHAGSGRFGLATSPEKRGLGISMGMGTAPAAATATPQGNEGQRSHQGTRSPSSVDPEEELEDSSFVYNDPDDPESEVMGLAGRGGDSASEGKTESVMVHVRLRPPKPGEKCAWIANTLSGSLSLEPGLAAQRVQQGAVGPFAFDGLLTGSANRPVYISVARPLVRSALDGYDGVIFAYGQTASGKTFTLSGDERGEEQGIIPRAVRDLFRGIKQSSARREYLLRASYLEIWNENVKDLLEPANAPQVRDDRRKGGRGTFVHPLREEIVTSPGQVRELLARGQANRHVGATDWNERSSRSHTCFKVTIESWERDADADAAGVFGGDGDGDEGVARASSRLGKKVRVSELCLIDLAGSEKYVSQGTDRRTEGAHINKSLLTLGKVIFALSEKTATSSSSSSSSTMHVPYRDSKLTRILQNSLSGNARVAVVCTINPTPTAVDESLSTLNFARRVKKVSLHARRHEVDGADAAMGGAEAQALVLRYREEAVALRKKVAELQSGAATPRIDDDRMLQLLERLDVIGSLVVRGGGMGNGGEGNSDNNDDDDEDDYEDDGYSGDFGDDGRPPARPVSPVRKGRGFAFSDPPHVLQEKLYRAESRIETLQRQLAERPAVPRDADEREALIVKLQRQVEELEMVCEAQATEAPPKIREDVEREWKGRVESLEQRLVEKERFVEEMSRELERLRRANQQLTQLAHAQTAQMVSQLHGAASVRKGTTMQRPVSVLGGHEIEAWRDSHTVAAWMAPSAAMPTAAAAGSTQATQARAPNRFRPRRSVSHDVGLLEKGLGKVKRELDNS
ncbi:Kinesin-like protein kip2 [Thecaphora frezii]